MLLWWASWETSACDSSQISEKMKKEKLGDIICVFFQMFWWFKNSEIFFEKLWRNKITPTNLGEFLILDYGQIFGDQPLLLLSSYLYSVGNKNSSNIFACLFTLRLSLEGSIILNFGLIHLGRKTGWADWVEFLFLGPPLSSPSSSYVSS